MIVTLAIRQGNLPSQWAEQDPVDVVTAIDVLNEMDEAAARAARQR